MAAAVLAGCGGAGAKGASTGPGSAASSTTETTAAAAASTAGCGRSGASTTFTPVVDGHTRTVVVHVPPRYVDTVATPLVLNMHGSGADAVDQEGFTGMDASADAHDFIVAYPQGLIPESPGFDWNVPGVPLVGERAVPAGAADDVAFLSHLVTLLEQRYCIDARRVYATGFSGGARMASQLACDAADVFAAVAPVSGLRRPTPCPAARPVPVLSFHGTADPVDPYDGHGQAYWTYSVPEAAALWASQDGCGSAPAVSHLGVGATATTYDACGGGASVELVTVDGEGHEWPGGPVLPPRLTRELGPQSDAVNADDLMWAFFAAHPLP